MEFSGKYLTYDEYKALGGTIDQTPFNLLEFEARRKIDARTQGRLQGKTNLPDEVRMCVFALINILKSYGSSTESGNKNIASETTDGYSVSYVTGGSIEENIKVKDVEINGVIKTYLLGVVVDGEHILYLGVK